MEYSRSSPRGRRRRRPGGHGIAAPPPLRLLAGHFARRGRRRFRVRPYVSTGVHIIPDNMSVSLANYGIGFSIVTKVAISRGDLKPRGVIFVQDQYCLSPGDSLLLATAKATNQSKAGDALKDWTNALEGVKIVVEYLDIFGEKFQYTRVISTRAIFES